MIIKIIIKSTLLIKTDTVKAYKINYTNNKENFI